MKIHLCLSTILGTRHLKIKSMALNLEFTVTTDIELQMLRVKKYGEDNSLPILQHPEVVTIFLQYSYLHVKLKCTYILIIHHAGDLTRVSVVPRKVTVKIGDAKN